MASNIYKINILRRFAIFFKQNEANYLYPNAVVAEATRTSIHNVRNFLHILRLGNARKNISEENFLT